MNSYLSRQPRSAKARKKDGRQLVILTGFGLAFLFALGALLGGCASARTSLSLSDREHQAARYSLARWQQDTTRLP